MASSGEDKVAIECDTAIFLLANREIYLQVAHSPINQTKMDIRCGEVRIVNDDWRIDMLFWKVGNSPLQIESVSLAQRS